MSLLWTATPFFAGNSYLSCHGSEHTLNGVRCWKSWQMARATVYMPHLHFTDDQTTLVQVMAWCRRASSLYLSQCWPRSLSPYGVTGPRWINSSLPGENGHPFRDDISKCIFMNEKCCILILLSLKFFPEGPINIKLVLFQVMAWRRTGAKSLPVTMLT